MKYEIGRGVKIYKHGKLVFYGEIENQNFKKSTSGSTLEISGSHRGWRYLKDRVCDYYRADNLSYAPVVNPWQFGRLTDTTNELVDGLRPDEILECLIGTKFIWQEWFDNHDYLRFEGQSLLRNHYYTSQNAYVSVGTWSSTYDAYGESFTPAINYYIGKVSVKGWLNSPTVTDGSIYAEVRKWDLGTLPSTATLVDTSDYKAVSTLPSGSSSTAAQWIEFAFSDPVAISASYRYLFTVKIDGADSTTALAERELRLVATTTSGEPYTDNYMLHRTSDGWESYDATDALWFKTNGTGTDYVPLIVSGGHLQLSKYAVAGTTTIADAQSWTGYSIGDAYNKGGQWTTFRPNSSFTLAAVKIPLKHYEASDTANMIAIIRTVTSHAYLTDDGPYGGYSHSMEDYVLNRGFPDKGFYVPDGDSRNNSGTGILGSSTVHVDAVNWETEADEQGFATVTFDFTGKGVNLTSGTIYCLQLRAPGTFSQTDSWRRSNSFTHEFSEYGIPVFDNDVTHDYTGEFINETYDPDEPFEAEPCMWDSRDHKIMKVTTITSDFYSTSGRAESIELYNGDKNVDPMGSIIGMSVVMTGSRYADNPILKVTRNRGDDNPTWHVVGLDYQAAADGTGTWSGSFNDWTANGVSNQFGYRIEMYGDGTGTSYIEYAKFTCTTNSDTSVTAGFLERYNDPYYDDDTIAINLAGKTRLEGIEEVRKLTNSTLYDTNWDCYIDNELRFFFRQLRGTTKPANLVSFGEDQRNITVTDRKYDGEVINTVIARGEGEEPYAVTIVGTELQDTSSIAEFGMRTGFFTDKSIPDAPTLLKKARAYLNYMKQPRESLKIDIHDEPGIDWGVGDVITVDERDWKFSTPYTYRVLTKKTMWSHANDIDLDITIGTNPYTLEGFFSNVNQRNTAIASLSQGTGAPTNPTGTPINFDSTTYAEYPFYIPEHAKRITISIVTAKYKYFGASSITTFGYYPGGVTMRIDSTSVDANATFGYLGNENTAATLYDLDLSHEFRDEDGMLEPGLHTLYFIGNVSDNNPNGVGRVYVSHKIVVSTALDVDYTPLPE